MERKRWDKQQDFHPSTASSTTESKPDPVLSKQLQYIKVLEERNRVKKRLAAASKRNERLHEREEAFVTAFNVPTRAQATSNSSRNVRSTTSVLPTKLPGKREEPKLTKCRSAPSTTLNFATGEDKMEQNRVRRAKWNRPQAQMDVIVDHEDGVPKFRLTENKCEEKGEDEEEDYLEESFEEFDENEDDLRDIREELVIHEIEDDEKRENVKENDFTIEDTSSQVDLSKTTKELFSIIQHLSRSKQRALVDVLQKFQDSEQDEHDVKVLKSSIGDPAIWKEITATLTATPATPAATETNETPRTSESIDLPAVAPLQNLLEEQLKWEDEYANKVKERLAQEREEKHRMLKEAEERRAKMMKQLEDEEREIEQLMEIKRQERLARLRALQEESNSNGKNTPLECTANGEMSSVTNVPNEVPIVPRLNLSSSINNEAAIPSKCYEIHVKLLSTWSKTRAVGLTQIYVYNLNGEELSVNFDTLQVYDQPTGRSLPKTNEMLPRPIEKMICGSEDWETLECS
ncbi:hypothetical protein PHMEG_00032977 [Phytophthora megakarya]|uniref:KATNIP domain-containing protein n=1 Tax=Phytophthora megakarya TaxID=4795 RepID=A0A225UU49_9STRA|nr:hypothetical protein PHMEG_00032977 [Phytophthora megakarya]